MQLIVATKNRNKLKEIKEILKDLDIEVLCLADLNPRLKIEEDGKTFLENAIKKAEVVSKLFKGTLVVGEDSGLLVPYLNNAPGVFSRRYAGLTATDYDNNVKLLKELEGVPCSRRRAYFCCTVALMKDGKLIKHFEGRLAGYIHHRITGKGGFGYDPVFYLPLYRKTVAQLSSREKNRISHRAKVFAKLKKHLVKYIKNK